MQDNHSIGEEKEVSLKDLVLTVKSYFYELLKGWKIYVLAILLAAGLLGLKAYLSIAYYPDSITFMINEGVSAAESKSNLLGSLFLSGKGTSSQAKVLELFRTKTIIHDALFEKADFLGNEDYLANHIIDHIGFDVLTDPYGFEWAQKIKNENSFSFSHDSIEIFNPREKATLKILYQYFVGNADLGISPILSTNVNEESEIMTINIRTTSEDLTIKLLDILYHKLSSFYIDKAIEKEKITYGILSERNDSIKTALNIAEYSLADFNDSNRNLVTLKGYLKKLQLERQARILSTMYNETVRQMEESNFALKNATPYIQIIDFPSKPITPRKESLMQGLILGTIIGGFLATIFIILRRMVRDALKE